MTQRFEITAPDGKRYEVTAPDDATQDQVLAYVKSQVAGSAERTVPGTIAQGLNVGLANLAGAPVDLVNAALGLVNLGTERPIGGSAQLRSLIAKIPTGTGPLVYQRLEDVPQELRPLARAGEAIGASVPIAGVPFAVTRPLAEVNRFVRPIVQAARETPRRFLATEAGGAFGAGQGAAIAELVRPGDPTAGAVGEITGGFVNPLGVVARSGTAIGRGVKMLASSVRRSGREATAAQHIQEAMIAAGEDPQRVASLLREADLSGVSLSAGQKAESPTLLALERSLAQKNPNFDAAMQRNVSANMEQLRKLLGQLEASGDPALLREAARMRERYFSTLIEGRLQAAEAQMQQAAKAIGGDEGRASARASSILEDALHDARKAEAELWKEVPRDVPLKASNTAKAYDDFLAGSYAERPAPPEFIGKFVQRVREAGAQSGELLAFRSDMLARARQARSQKNWVDARIYEDMADGALADIAVMQGNAASEARAFSKTLNDTFSRTFAGDALAVKTTGQERIAPEAVLRRGYGSGGVLANKRFQELETAAQFSGKSMVHEQEEFLRAAAQATVDPQTGRVNPRQLEGFLRSNEQMLERYPALRQELANAASAEVAFRQVQEATKQASKAIEQRAAFAEVLRNESPANAIRNVLNSAQPEHGYEQLIRLARRGPQGASDGLKASTLDYAARNATSATGEFSFERYREILTRPISPRGPSLLKMMGQRGVMKPEEIARLDLILRNAEKIELSLASKARIGEIVAQPDALFDLVVRGVGANIGGHSLFSQGTGAPLVMAGAGVRAARRLFEKLPRTRVIDVMMEAAENPRLMAALLEKPRTVARAEQLKRQINGFLLQAGLVPREEVAQEE